MGFESKTLFEYAVELADSSSTDNNKTSSDMRGVLNKLPNPKINPDDATGNALPYPLQTVVDHLGDSYIAIEKVAGLLEQSRNNPAVDNIDVSQMIDDIQHIARRIKNLAETLDNIEI